MAKPIVFMLHGMGNQEKDWSKKAFEILEKRAAALNPNWKLIHEELEYDSKFRNLLSAWAKNSRQIIKDAQPANQQFLKDSVGWLNKADDKNSFAWTAAADVFLWRTSDLIRKLIINHVANQIAQVMKSAPAAQARNVHFIGHSLGTAVLHEVLTALANGAWTPDDGTVDGLAAKQWRPMGIHTVANVSRALQLDRNRVYESPVKPGSSGDPTSYCQVFLNYGHKLDPFAQIAPFDPPWAPSPRYGSFEPQRIKDPKEVHALTSYLNLPTVNVPMLETMFDPLPPGSTALGEVPAGYKMPKKLIEDELKEKIEKFGKDSNLFEQIRSAYDYFKGL